MIGTTPDSSVDTGFTVGTSLQAVDERRLRDFFSENRMAGGAAAWLAFCVLFCFVGPVVYRTNQIQVNLLQVGQAPTLHHLLGTDEVGYDELGRLMIAGQSTLVIGLAAAAFATIAGTLWGAVAATIGGFVDSVMMRLLDMMLAIPALFLILFVSTIVVPSQWILIVVIGGTSWLIPARLVRAEALSLRSREFVEVARGLGAGRIRIVTRHILPNAFGVIAVSATLQAANAILIITYLSFLGLGIPPPAADWGSMLSTGVTYILSGEWWLVWPPGLLIVSVVLALNFLGGGVQDWVDVRRQQR